VSGRTDDGKWLAMVTAFIPLRSAVGHRTGPQPVATAREPSGPLNTQLVPGHGLRHYANQSGVGRGGIEPPTPGFSIGVSSAHESAITGYHHTGYVNTSDGPITEPQQYRQETAEFDPDLGQLIEAWPTLPPAIREAILAMLRVAE